MILNKSLWNKLFLLCLGIFISSAFCMKWMEEDFLHNGELFTIIGIEITYSKEKIMSIFSEIGPDVKSILRYHLVFDFVFMAGVYPGIASLCMIARERNVNTTVRTVLSTAALSQIIASGCDITENIFLLNWLKSPFIGNEILFFHFIVVTKWSLAILSVLVAVIFLCRKRQT